MIIVREIPRVIRREATPDELTQYNIHPPLRGLYEKIMWPDGREFVNVWEVPVDFDLNQILVQG